MANENYEQWEAAERAASKYAPKPPVRFAPKATVSHSGDRLTLRAISGHHSYGSSELETKSGGACNLSLHHGVIEIKYRSNGELPMATTDPTDKFTKNASATVESLQEDLASMRDNVGMLSQQVVDLLSAKGGAAYKSAKKRVVPWSIMPIRYGR